MSRSGPPSRANIRALIAGGFAVPAAVAAGNAAAMLGLHGRGYGTLPLAVEAAAYAAAAAWCAVGLRAGRAPGRARSLRGPLAAWVVSGPVVWLTVALTYRPGPTFWAISGAAIVAWGAAGAWAHRRLSGRRLRVEPQLLAAPRSASSAVGAGAPEAGTAGVSRQAAAYPAVGA